MQRRGWRGNCIGFCSPSSGWMDTDVYGARAGAKVSKRGAAAGKRARSARVARAASEAAEAEAAADEERAQEERLQALLSQDDNV